MFFELYGEYRDLHTRSSIDRHVTERLSQALLDVSNGAVSPTIDVDAFRAELAEMDFGSPHAANDMIDWVIEKMTTGQVHMTHPRHFGLFNPAPTHAAECADRIAAAFNPQTCVWSHAPVAVDIEAHVIARFASRIGLPGSAGGHFTSGGSEANHTALICALPRAHPDYAARGVRALDGQPCVYASRESHLAWLKLAHETGIGRDAVRLIDTDGNGRMDQRMLRSAIQRDLAQGNVPIMIAATAGTTNAGRADPLHDCADIARRHKLWMHADAAWGGGLIASERLHSELAGIERADSITIDAHKWFATTMGAGMFLTQHTDLLANAFQVSTSYMPSNDQSVDLYVNSMQWSRRFVGLRLFLALAIAGWQGFAAHVERGVQLMERLTGTMLNHGWQVANDSRMAVACLIPPTASRPITDIVTQIVDDNQHWISQTRFENTPVIRACITNGRSDEADIDCLATALEAARQR